MSHKTILVLDDEEAVLTLVQAQLEREGYKVLVASNEEEFNAFLSEEPIGLILTDLNMPDYSGLQVLEQVKRDKPDIPVIVVTGNAEESCGRKAVEMGAFDYVTKPIDFSYLRRTVSMILG